MLPFEGTKVSHDLCCGFYVEATLFKNIYEKDLLEVDPRFTQE